MARSHEKTEIAIYTWVMLTRDVSISKVFLLHHRIGLFPGIDVGYASLAFAPKPGQGLSQLHRSTLKRGQEPDHDYDTTSQELTNVGRILIVFKLDADTFAPVR